MTVSKHPVIHHFLHSASNLQPLTVHCFPMWDLHKVLTALMISPFKPLRLVCLHFLSFKVAFLVAMPSARHISELAALLTCQDFCLFHPDRVVLHLDPAFVPKANSLFHRAQELVLPNICPTPYHCLECSWHTWMSDGRSRATSPVNLPSGRLNLYLFRTNQHLSVLRPRALCWSGGSGLLSPPLTNGNPY